MASWNEVANSEKYKALPDSEKRVVADRFYSNVVAKSQSFMSLPDTEKEALKTRFYMKSGFAPQQEEPKGPSFMERMAQYLPKDEFEEQMQLKKGVAPVLGKGVGFALGGVMSDEQASKLAERAGKRFPESKIAQIGAAALGTAGTIISPVDIATLGGSLWLKGSAAYRGAMSALDDLAKGGMNLVEVNRKRKEIEGIYDAFSKTSKAVENQPASRVVLEDLQKKLNTVITGETKRPQVLPRKPQPVQAPIPRPVEWAGEEKARAAGLKIQAQVPPSSRPERPFTVQAGITDANREALQSLRSQLPPGPQALPPSAPQMPTVAPRAPGAAPQVAGQAIPPAPGAIPTDPAQKIIAALKNATRIRGKQEGIYEAERARRTASIAGIEKEVPGQAGFLAQKAALKGPMEKVEFESILKDLTQQDVDGLFKQVTDSPNLSGIWERFNTKVGLQKLLGVEGAKVPTESELALLQKVFGQEFVKEVLSKRSTLQKTWDIGKDVLNLPRSIMSTLDLSMPFRQGAFLIGRPKQFLPAFRDMFKYAWDEKAYDGLMDAIRARPTYDLMQENGLAITTVGELGPREEQFASNLAERIPVFGKFARASNRAAAGFLNKLRADVFDDLVQRATETGAIKEAGTLKNIARFVNTATGRGEVFDILKGSQELLNATFFSPRLMASRMQLLNPKFYAELDPFTRKEALKSLFSSAGAALSVLGLAKAAGADVGVDPRSADFLKIKVGDTRYDVGAGFQQYLVLAARLLSGEMVSSTTGKEFQLGEGYKATTRGDIVQRFMESKSAPIASFALGLLSGNTTMGEEFDVPTEVIDRVMPMVVQDVTDLTREWGPMGALMALPGTFGIGSQTYADQVPVRERTKSGQERIRWKQAPSVGGIIANKIRGVSDTNVPADEAARLREEKKSKDAETIALDNARARVLETGNPEQVGGKLVYLDRGVVRTRDFMPTEDLEGKTMVGGVTTELRTLGINFEPNLEQAQYLLDEVIKHPDYKFATRDQKRQAINRVILGTRLNE